MTPAATVRVVDTEHRLLDAAHQVAELAERAARDELVSHGITSEPHYQAWERAMRDLLDARGRLYAGEAYVQDGGTATRDAWCQCRHEPGERHEQTYFEAFDDHGNRVSHGMVCATCRRVTQAG